MTPPAPVRRAGSLPRVGTMEKKSYGPLAPLFWFAVIIMVIQSVIFVAGRAADEVPRPSWALPVLIGVGVLVAAICVLLVWKWRLWVPAVLLAAGTGLAYLGILGWVFGVALVIVGIVVSLIAASPAGRIEARTMRWDESGRGAGFGPVAVLVGLAILVVGLETVIALLSTDGIDFDTATGPVDDPFRFRLILICAILLAIIAAIYAAAYGAWLAGLCLLVAAVGSTLGFFVLVPTSAFGVLGIALSFVQPKRVVAATGREIVVEAE